MIGRHPRDRFPFVERPQFPADDLGGDREDDGDVPLDPPKPSGAVRSGDAERYDFTSMPWLGILAVAATSREGAAKYGRFNYMKGFPLNDLLNHVHRHLAMFELGDRSEPHLAHAAWGILAAIQADALTPELSAPHMLGPGATLTPAVLEHLDANAEDLARRRAAGEFGESAGWQIADLPEVRALLEQRKA